MSVVVFLLVCDEKSVAVAQELSQQCDIVREVRLRQHLRGCCPCQLQLELCITPVGSRRFSFRVEGNFPVAHTYQKVRDFVEGHCNSWLQIGPMAP